MANVTLPNIDTAETDIKVLVPQMLNAYAKLTKELSWLLNNLDTRNLNYVDGDLLVEGSVTAAKLIVQELSAISANLGHITAGLIESIEIYGSYIATRNGAFPRAEMNEDDDLFAAYRDASNYIKIQPNIAGAPALRFTSSDVVIGSLNSTYGHLEIWAPVILALTAQKVQFDNWYKLYNKVKDKTLGDELDEIWEAINNKADIAHTHSVTIPNHNHGNPDNLNSGGGTFTVS